MTSPDGRARAESSVQHGTGGRALAAQLFRHAEAITDLRRQLADTTRDRADTTQTLADLLTRLHHLEAAVHHDDATTPGARPRSAGAGWCWATLGPRATATLHAELTAWVAWLRSRYPLARRVPPCWADHPELVEELTALWLAWQAAYTHPDAHPTAPADWHDRWLPGLLHRLTHGPFATDCDPDQHRPRTPSAYANPQEEP